MNSLPRVTSLLVVWVVSSLFWLERDSAEYPFNATADDVDIGLEEAFLYFVEGSVFSL